MRRKLLLVLIAIMVLMIALMGIPGSAKRVMDPKPKAGQSRLQGLKPQVVRAVGFAKTKPLRDLPPAPNSIADTLAMAERRELNEKNEELERVQKPGAPQTLVDGALSGKKKTSSPSGAGVSVTPPPTGSFEGISDADNTTVGLGLVNPPDTNADVGYSQIVETVNSTFRVYDKAGNPLSPVMKQSTLFAPLGGICASSDAGDPIVLHDRIGDRWNISQFSFTGTTTPPYHQCIALSQTSDATGEYYLYDFELPGNEFPDYPKLGVWPDGYYMTTRQFTMGGPFNGIGAFAFNRDKMLAGDPTAELIYFTIPNDANYPSSASSGMLPSDHDGLLPPPAGAPNVFAIYDDDEFGAGDELHLFDFHADFTTPANSTFTERPESPIAVAPFDDRNPSGRADLEEPSPGENMDTIGDRLMFRLQYRNRDGVESLVTDHTVNVSGATPSTPATHQAAPRYYELRKSAPGDPYTVYDQATYSPDAGMPTTGLNRWMGSTNIDNQGNLAVGYSISSPTVLPSIAYVGREFGELGASLTNEQILFPGQGTMAAGDGNRWGDYTSLSVDPTDDCTFWHANEYWPTGNTSFNWHTRIGNFKFPTCTAPPQGTLSGTITACDSGVPLGEVLITATGGPSDRYSAATADDGTYTLHLAPGTYTVTATSDIRNCQDSASTQVTITDGGMATFSTCLNGSPNFRLPENNLMPITVGDSSGNNNGQIDKNECVTLNVQVQNEGCAPAHNIVATLSTTTPGVTITQPTSPYPDMPIDATATNTIPFGVSTSPSFVCGTPIEFTLTLNFTGGSDVVTFTLQTCQLPPQMFSGTVEPTDPATANGRIARNGAASTCAGKTCPGTTGSGPRSYDTYSFVNQGGVDACATINVSSACGSILLASAYLDSFDPNNLCNNYLGDPGASSTMQHFSVTVPAGHTLIVVVMATNNNTTTCAYTGTVSGLIGNISGGGECADVGVTKTDSPDPVFTGELLTYNVHVQNNGPGLATNVVLKDYLPTSSSFVSVSPDGPTCTHSGDMFGGIVTCNLDSLGCVGDRPGGGGCGTADVQIVVRTRGNANTIFNKAVVTSTGPDGNPTNDQAIEPTTVLTLRRLTFTPNSVTGGCEDSTGKLEISSPAGMGGLTVNLHSGDPHVQVPPMVTIPEGETSMTFPATTSVVNAQTVVTVTAIRGMSIVTGRIKLLPVRITSLTFDPNPVHGGMDTTAKVVLSCASDEDITIRFTSNRAAAQPVSPIVIPAGQMMGTTTIHTLHVTSSRVAVITAIISEHHPPEGQGRPDYVPEQIRRANLTIIP